MKASYLRFSPIPILLSGLFYFLLCIPQITNATVSSSELQALTDIYNTMNGPNWVNKNYWLTGDPCTAPPWAGVVCTGERVTGFWLDNNNIVGSFPNSVGGLKYLTWISVNGNSITGNMYYIFSLFSTSVYSMWVTFLPSPNISTKFFFGYSKKKNIFWIPFHHICITDDWAAIN